MCVNDLVVQGAEPLALPRLFRDRQARRRDRAARSSPASPTAASRPAAPWSAARPRKCPACMPRAITISPALPSARSSASQPITGIGCDGGRCRARPRLLGRAFQRLFAGAQDRSSRERPELRARRRRSMPRARRLGEALPDADEDLREVAAWPRSARKARNWAASRRWRISPAAASWRTSRASCRRTLPARSTPPAGTCRRSSPGCARSPGTERAGNGAHLQLRHRHDPGGGAAIGADAVAQASSRAPARRCAEIGPHPPAQRRRCPAAASSIPVNGKPMPSRPSEPSKVAVLISGRGSNLQALIDHFGPVITSRPDPHRHWCSPTARMPAGARAREDGRHPDQGDRPQGFPRPRRLRRDDGSRDPCGGVRSWWCSPASCAC